MSMNFKDMRAADRGKLIGMFRYKSEYFPRSAARSPLEKMPTAFFNISRRFGAPTKLTGFLLFL